MTKRHLSIKIEKNYFVTRLFIIRVKDASLCLPSVFILYNRHLLLKLLHLAVLHRRNASFSLNYHVLFKFLVKSIERARERESSLLSNTE